MKKRPARIQQEEKALVAIHKAAKALGWTSLALPAVAPDEPVPGLILGTKEYVDRMRQPQHVGMALRKGARR